MTTPNKEETIDTLDSLILFMATLGWHYGKYDDQCFHVFNNSGNNTMTIKQAQAIKELFLTSEQEAYKKAYIAGALEGFNKAFDSHDYDNLRKYRAELESGTADTKQP